jgi:hypothetical protein
VTVDEKDEAQIEKEYSGEIVELSYEAMKRILSIEIFVTHSI